MAISINLYRRVGGKEKKVTNAGDFQLELNQAYSKKMDLELEIRSLKLKNLGKQPMIDEVYDKLMEEVTTELKEVEEYIDMLWSASEMTRDEYDKINNNLRMAGVSISLNNIPF